MRCLVRTADKWKQEHPDNLSAWLWQHDGAESVVIDGNVYYCGTEELKAQYEAKWKEENKLHEKRRTSDLLTLDKILFNRDGAGTPSNDAWCEGEGCYCAAIIECNGSCL